MLTISFDVCIRFGGCIAHNIAVEMIRCIYCFRRFIYASLSPISLIWFLHLFICVTLGRYNKNSHSNSHTPKERNKILRTLIETLPFRDYNQTKCNSLLFVNACHAQYALEINSECDLSICIYSYVCRS